MSPSQPLFRFNLTIDGEQLISTPYLSYWLRVSDRLDLDLVALLPQPALLTPNPINSPKRHAPLCEECEGGVCDI